jgi:hypothetical protein
MRFQYGDFELGAAQSFNKFESFEQCVLLIQSQFVDIGRPRCENDANTASNRQGIEIKGFSISSTWTTAR